VETIYGINSVISRHLSKTLERFYTRKYEESQQTRTESEFLRGI
jgi:hypothetical protein